MGNVEWYGQPPKSRPRIGRSFSILSFVIGFLLWQISLSAGAKLAASGIPTWLTAPLIWGSPLLACFGLLFLTGLHQLLCRSLDFSAHRIRQQETAMGMAFGLGLLLSLAGAAAGLAETPPLNLAYLPLASLPAAFQAH